MLKLKVFLTCANVAAENLKKSPKELEELKSKTFTGLGLATKQDWDAFCHIWADMFSRVSSHAAEKMPSEIAAEKWSPPAPPAAAPDVEAEK